MVIKTRKDTNPFTITLKRMSSRGAGPESNFTLHLSCVLMRVTCAPEGGKSKLKAVNDVHFLNFVPLVILDSAVCNRGGW